MDYPEGIKLLFEIAPQEWQRAAPTVRKKPTQFGYKTYGSVRDTVTNKLYKEQLGYLARMQLGPMKPFEGPLRTYILFYLAKPASGKPGSKMDNPFCKPDIDNLEKQLFDGLNGIVWKDDAQIVVCCKQKLWAEGNEAARTLLIVSPYEAIDPEDIKRDFDNQYKGPERRKGKNEDI